MNLVQAVAGGLVGTLLLTSVLRAATELHLTRIDLPFLLGTAVTDDRTAAKALGYALHLLFGQLFAFVYLLLFTALERNDWWLGALFGAGHGLFAGTVLINVLLPLVHPRMGSEMSDATQVSLIEAPGFLGLNYGPRTAGVGLFAHVVFGITIAAFVHGPS
jgi:hypothetical protein